MERYQEKGVRLLFRADAAFAKPEVYEYLESRDIGYAMRLPANEVLQRYIRHLLKRPVGRPPKKARRLVPRLQLLGQDLGPIPACSGKGGVAPGELFPRVGVVVTNVSLPAVGETHFYNGRATAEQWIKEGNRPRTGRGSRVTGPLTAEI